MNDPYSTLGVKQTASDDEIKRAYRELARKYHPDNYQDNPLSDLAEEKMKEINEAYEAITKTRGGGGSSAGGYTYSGSYGGHTSRGGSSYQSRQYGFDHARVRDLINAGQTLQAEQILSAAADRGAEWHFLMGTVSYRKGWLDEATQHFQIACNLEPSNLEYRRSMDAMLHQRQAYNPFGGGSMVGGQCDCCTTLLCLNCLCGGCR